MAARKPASVGTSDDLVRQAVTLAAAPARPIRAPAYDAQAALNLLGEGLPDFAEAILSMDNASPLLRPALASLRAGALDDVRARLRELAGAPAP